MALKASKSITVEEFLGHILKYAGVNAVDFQNMALAEAAEGNDFKFIVRDVMFILEKQDIVDYYTKNGLETSFGGVASTDGFGEAVEKTSAKRGPGRPRKADAPEA